MKTMRQILNEGKNNGNQQGGKLNEGEEKGKNKVVNTPKPLIEPAPQKPIKK